MGVAMLPCFVGDVSAQLRRLTPPERSLQSALWLLTHPDLRRAARIKIFIEFMAAALRRKRRVLAGE